MSRAQKQGSGEDKRDGQRQQETAKDTPKRRANNPPHTKTSGENPEEPLTGKPVGR